MFQSRCDGPKRVKDAMVLCYSADGTRLWERKGEVGEVTVIGNRIYLKAYGPDEIMLLCLSCWTRTMLCCVLQRGASGIRCIPVSIGAEGIPRGDLQDAGCLQVPYLSDMSVSPDGTLLFCAGYGSGLAVIDLDAFKPRQEARSREDFCGYLVDGKNRLWVNNRSYFECYSPDLKLLSRHRLAGDILDYSLNQDGEFSLVTYQRSKYLTRVYRFY